jgi:hypothetical protein
VARDPVRLESSSDLGIAADAGRARVDRWMSLMNLRRPPWALGVPNGGSMPATTTRISPWRSATGPRAEVSGGDLRKTPAVRM